MPEKDNNGNLFAHRHIGPRSEDIELMLTTLGYSAMADFIEDVVPADIRSSSALRLDGDAGGSKSESEAPFGTKRNRLRKSGFPFFYRDGILQLLCSAGDSTKHFGEPSWYTQYTPYQAEISQGRLEALLNFQTMVIDLTGLPVANASLLDEGTAAAEAMGMCLAPTTPKEYRDFFVSKTCHPQTLAVLQTRAEPLGIRLSVCDHRSTNFTTPILGAIVQYPATDGAIHDYSAFAEQVHAAGGLFIAATDLLALTLLRPPGEFGADIAIGSRATFWCATRLWWSTRRLSCHT